MKSELNPSSVSASALSAGGSCDKSFCGVAKAEPIERAAIKTESFDEICDGFDHLGVGSDDGECTTEEVLQALGNIEQAEEKAQAARTRMVNRMTRQYPNLFRDWNSRLSDRTS
ncbi:hypothetical protein [Tardiphaga sp. 42S5]|uniref:hypothetical protein n=1 Tax=Tardiphaga sp. 42S5 TaxID=1404799 RepID=UPI002A5B0143|nr:hypothetical protein [Tardiphaga sp. 42S5]WPO42032.1 hypothetical protein SFY93_02335 [Tardiphaga sp. 42S5]